MRVRGNDKHQLGYFIHYFVICTLVLTGDIIICNSCIIPFSLYSLPFILFREC